ncbi:TPA: hypothetical protein QB278_002122 [Pasteurella multocida]|nr:hypothetical protein [Pasteurella multocida]
MQSNQEKIQLSKEESENLTKKLNSERDPFSQDPVYYALSEKDMELLKKDPNFVEEDHDFEKTK